LESTLNKFLPSNSLLSKKSFSKFNKWSAQSFSDGVKGYPSRPKPFLGGLPFIVLDRDND
jgi:hypothetical protein